MVRQPEPRKPNVTYSAPVGSIDLAAIGYVIWPCNDCLPWHVEIIRADDGEIIAREWHAVDCEHFQDLLRDD